MLSKASYRGHLFSRVQGLCVRDDAGNKETAKLGAFGAGEQGIVGTRNSDMESRKRRH